MSIITVASPWVVSQILSGCRFQLHRLFHILTSKSQDDAGHKVSPKTSGLMSCWVYSCRPDGLHMCAYVGVWRERDHLALQPVTLPCLSSLTGLGSLFSTPDLSRISDAPLRVASIRHASTVELSEEGVEASATTVVTTTRSISLFSVNSPFLFTLVDDASLVPLFMGIVTNPAPDNDRMVNDDPHVNGTMSDQPIPVSSNHSHSTCSETEPAGGRIAQSCSAPTGEREQLQQENLLKK